MGASEARLGALGWALVATGILLALVEAVWRVGGGFPIHQIGANLPTFEMQAWWAMWWVLGTLAALALARSLFLAADGHEERLAAWWSAGSDRAWVVGGAVAAFGLSAAVCWGALGGRHHVVDESAYLFMARVLAQGRLWVPSYPEAGFYDRGFMINDGKMYAQYFVGWPAMLAPFARLGLEQWANPVWYAATVPVVFGVLRRLVGSAWARLGLVLFATAPMAVFGAGTQAAHTGCTFWLACVFASALRASDEDAPPWAAAALALSFAAAFFVRPTTAIGIGGPVLAWWLASRWRRSDGRRWRDGLWFAVPSVALGAAFLLVNRAQTGDPFTVAYTQFHVYTHQSPFLPDFGPDGQKALDFRDAWRLFTGPMTALFRLNYALLGWPSSFLLVPFGIKGPMGRLFLASGLCMLGVHAFVSDPGIMAYGPVHYQEMLLPVVFLTVLGARALCAVAVPAWTGPAVRAGVAALCLVAVAGYWPWRLQNLAAIGAATAIPYEMTEALGPSVVFVPNGRWLPHCVDERVHAFHVSRPDNPPDLDARVLWVNHVSVAHDQGFLARHHPDRQGWILHWDDACVPHLYELAKLGPDDVPAFFRPKGLARFDHLLLSPREAP